MIDIHIGNFVSVSSDIDGLHSWGKDSHRKTYFIHIVAKRSPKEDSGPEDFYWTDLGLISIYEQDSDIRSDIIFEMLSLIRSIINNRSIALLNTKHENSTISSYRIL